MMDEHKSGPCLNKKTPFFLARGAPTLPALCLLNWLPQENATAEQIKVVTMGAPHNRYVTFLWALIVFTDMNGFSVFFSWWSMIGVSVSENDSGVSMVQKMILVSACWSSFEMPLLPKIWASQRNVHQTSNM